MAVPRFALQLQALLRSASCRRDAGATTSAGDGAPALQLQSLLRSAAAGDGTPALHRKYRFLFRRCRLGDWVEYGGFRRAMERPPYNSSG